MPNKQQEQIYLKWFMQHAHVDCEIIDEDRESPDFIVRINGETVGIEVTNIFTDSTSTSSGSGLKEQESYRAKWLSDLARKYYQSESVPVDLTLWWRHWPPDFEAATESVLRALDAHQVDCWEEATTTIEDGACELAIVRLDDSFANYDKWRIVNDHVTFVTQLTPAHLDRAITKKSTRIDKYLKSCESIWLLVVADAIWNSGKFGVESPLPSIQSRFDEVWLARFPHSIMKIPAAR